ncbi:MAG: hypothetical protein CME04_20305 [Gemmatimonadaceae bacterium]|nr:hypothetical protein [Gemmatimonadaceae bacterium]
MSTRRGAHALGGANEEGITEEPAQTLECMTDSGLGTVETGPGTRETAFAVDAVKDIEQVQVGPLDINFVHDVNNNYELD